MYKTILGAAVSAMLLASPVFATSYTIDGFVNSSDGGFTSTLFHEATGCNSMCGATIVTATGTGSGTWNDTTGDISFVMDLSDGGTASVKGLLNFAGLPNATFVGSFRTTFAGTTALTGTHYTMFRKQTYNAPEGVNAFQNGIIGLWGAAGGTPVWGGGLGFTNALYGADLRIKVSPIPLPASGFLLLTALGGIGFASRRRKTKAGAA